MTPLTLRNLLTYILIWALVMVLGWLATLIATGMLWGFRPGEPLADGAAQASVALLAGASALGTWLSANRPRLGREDISALVTEIGAINVRTILSDVVYRQRVRESDRA